MTSSHETDITLEQIPTSVTPDTPSSEIAEILQQENIPIHRDIIDYVKHAYWRCMNARDRASEEIQADETLKPDFRSMLVLAKNNRKGNLIEYRKFKDVA